MFSRTFGHTVVRVERTDITQLAVDAIVNAANAELWMGGGVAGAINRAGGPGIEREARAKGPIAVGDAVVTSAGQLPCRYVIHAATMGSDLRTDAGKIRAATRNGLRRAEELELSSLAFPALGTGVGGFSMDEAAQLMVQEIAGHVQAGSSLHTIILTAFSGDAERALSTALEGVRR